MLGRDRHNHSDGVIAAPRGRGTEDGAAVAHGYALPAGSPGHGVPAPSLVRRPESSRETTRVGSLGRRGGTSSKPLAKANRIVADGERP